MKKRIGLTVFKTLVIVVALLMIAAGTVTAITPIPFGLPLIVLGFLMLATASPVSVRWLRIRWRWFDRRLKWVQDTLPRWMTGTLRRTDPDLQSKDKDEEQEDDREVQKEGASAPTTRHEKEDGAAFARRMLSRRQA